MEMTMCRLDVIHTVVCRYFEHTKTINISNTIVLCNSFVFVIFIVLILFQKFSIPHRNSLETIKLRMLKIIAIFEIKFKIHLAKNVNNNKKSLLLISTFWN